MHAFFADGSLFFYKKKLTGVILLILKTNDLSKEKWIVSFIP